MINEYQFHKVNFMGHEKLWITNFHSSSAMMEFEIAEESKQKQNHRSKTNIASKAAVVVFIPKLLITLVPFKVFWP